jgi:hypothetical protein
MIPFPHRPHKLPPLLEPDEHASAVIRIMLERGAKCRLCKGEPAAFGVWFPPPSARFCEWWYGLCLHCLLERPHAQQEAEASLRRQLLAEEN